MFVVVVGEVALALGFAHAGKAVGGGELGHDEAAAGLLVRGTGVDVGIGCAGGELAGVLDEAAEDGVGDACHGSEDGGGRDGDIADLERGGDACLGGHGVLERVVPVLLHGWPLQRKGLRLDGGGPPSFWVIVTSRLQRPWTRRIGRTSCGSGRRGRLCRSASVCR